MVIDTLRLEKLSDLLHKDPIIATFASGQLARHPEVAEYNYSVHASTHIPLGDTGRYVDTIAKWVTGQNKGAFIGAVTGDYGEGKTSFLVHVWEQATARGIMAVPPFSWRSVADLIVGIHGWASYKLKELHPDEARAADKLWEKYRQKSLEETARRIAKESGRDIDIVLQILAQANTNLEVTAEKFLDYCAELSQALPKTKYRGLLVLLDEPEVAARGLSTSEVAQVLFDIANGLLSREGNYGVFVSIPQTFLAQIQASFSSLPDRLAGRQAFFRLGNLYNAAFASILWDRYAQQLGFTSIKHEIISLHALEAIGQVTSSARRDLSNGPRAVISAFRRAIKLFQEDGITYSPKQFVEDCLDQEVLVKSNSYGNYISQILASPEAEAIGIDCLQVLCAFPNGVQQDRLAELGLDSRILEIARPGHPLLYRRGGYVGLQLLKEQHGGTDQQDLLQQSIQDIMGSYAPKPEVAVKAIEAFVKNILPIVFKKREGNALVGWRYDRDIELDKRIRLVELTGAFEQTKKYPLRKVHVVVSDPEANTEKLLQRYKRGEEPDILLHLRLHWSLEKPLPGCRADIEEGDPSENEPGVNNFVLDLVGSRIEQEQLEQYLGAADMLTPLGILYLMHEMDKLSLPQQEAAIWDVIKKNVLPKLMVPFFGDPSIREQVTKEKVLTLPGSPTDLIPTLCRYILSERYPNYTTLIVQPSWAGKVQTYANVINNQSIPLAARRGQEPWIAPRDDVARVFNTSVMNLTGGWTAGLESLLAISGEGSNLRVDFRLHPLEQEIQSVIMSGKPEERIKINDQECFWTPFEELYPLTRSSGYSEEEWKEIVEIGKNRGTFDVERHKGKPILYCLPFNRAQMQLKLREKLADLRSHVEAFRTIPSYKASVDFEVEEKNIEALQDEAAFDQLQNRLNRVFEQDNARLPHFFNQLHEELNDLERKTRQVQNDLKGGAFTGLDNPPTFQSSWGSDFNRYIMNNLSHDARAVRRECDNILLGIQGVVSNHVQNKGGAPVEKAQRIGKGWRQYLELKEKLDQAEVRARNLSMQVRDYDKWRSMLVSRSDVLYKNLLEDQQDSSYRAKADEFLSELEVLWKDISEHLQERTLSGLGSYKQFEARFQEIEEARASIKKTLAEQFNNAKSRINQVLESAQVDRCKEAFNPNDVQGCYTRLYNEAVGNVRAALDIGLQEVDKEVRELRYGRDVLKRVPSAEAEALLEELALSRATVLEATKHITAEWAKAASKDEGQEQEVVALFKTALDQASRHAQQARLLLKRSGLEDPVLGTVSKEMLGLLENPQDLKALVLSLIERGHDSEKVLDMSLAALSELFRQGKVNIKVEQSRR